MRAKLDWRIAAVGAAVLVGAATVSFAQPYGGMGGPGMMGNGPGAMMGGNGYGYGMGPGMMWGGLNQAYAGLDLSADQRKKIDAIEEETSKAMWQMMGTMHDQGFQMGRMMGGATVNDADARKAYEAMATTRKAMFELQLDARKRIDAVLTAKQREQLQRGGTAR